MNFDREIKRRRKLVVLFYADKVDDSWLMERIIQSDQGDYPQLVHRQLVQQSEIDRQQSVEENSSSIQHLFIRMKLNQRSTRIKPSPSAASLILERPRSPTDEAVWEAYKFISRKHKPGDDVILLVNTWTESLSGGEYQLKAAQALAKYLHYGTRPSDPSEFRYERGDSITGKRIPIHCAGIISPGITGSISRWNDQLKSRFPPGIEHIICWWQSGNDQTCSTTCRSDGDIISREICIHNNSYVGYRTFIYSTRDVIYYKPEELPKWGTYNPEWTQELSALQDGSPGIPCVQSCP